MNIQLSKVQKEIVSSFLNIENEEDVATLLCELIDNGVPDKEVKRYAKELQDLLVYLNKPINCLKVYSEIIVCK